MLFSLPRERGYAGLKIHSACARLVGSDCYNFFLSGPNYLRQAMTLSMSFNRSYLSPSTAVAIIDPSGHLNGPWLGLFGFRQRQ